MQKDQQSALAGKKPWVLFDPDGEATEVWLALTEKDAWDYAFGNPDRHDSADIKAQGWKIVEATIEWEVEKVKTAKQRASLHVWLEQLAEILNSAGLDQRKVLKPAFFLSWTKHSVKEYLYKPLLEAMTGKESTEKMNTIEPSEICKELGKHLATKHGITPPAWPTRFEER
jgi:hypothetical protein